MSQVAMCYCGEPLVSTFAFRGYEFICVHCGLQYTWLQPDPADESKELLARCDENKADWVAVSNGLLPPRSYRDDCERCGSEFHREHATVEEVASHEAAIERMSARGLPVPR